MGIFDFLGGGQAQMPGQAQQAGFMQNLLAPEVALPMAHALLGREGNAANLGNAFGVAGKQMAQTSQRNKTMDFFRKNAPEYAQMIDSGMDTKDAFELYTKARTAQTASPEFFGTPIYGKNAQGQMVLGQLNKSGTFQETALPEGFELQPGVDRVDLGTAWGITNRAGEVVSTIPKDLAGAEREKAIGTGQGEAAIAAPAAGGLAGQINEQVNSLKTDPYLPNMLGPIDSRLPNVTQASARVQGKIDQLKGGAFLQARQLLKGGGAITDFEGQKAEAAFVRMNEAQSVEDFNAALDEFNGAVQAGLRKLQTQAGQGGGQPAPSGGGGGYKIIGVE